MEAQLTIHPLSLLDLLQESFYFGIQFWKCNQLIRMEISSRFYKDSLKDKSNVTFSS